MSSVTTYSARQRVVMRTPKDILEMVPFLLGFHPVDSLVMIGLDRDRSGAERVGVVGRMNRCAGDDPLLPEALDQLFTPARRSEVTRAVAAWFGRPPDLDELRELERAAGRADCELLDVLTVSDGRWRSLLCTKDGCCPPDGRPLDPDSVLVTEATYGGLVARPSRDSVQTILEADPDRDRLLPALRTAESSSASGRHDRAAVRRLFAASRRLGVLTDDELCDYGSALRRTGVRDACWLGIDDRRIAGDALWQELSRRLPAPYDLAPLFLFGWLIWRGGNGTLARMAAERALAIDPDYSAAAMLLTAVQHGLDPFRTPRLRSRRPR